ncbi:MAG: reverse transcriptase domain-containing protein [Patescibacteria group bacterium]|jgi:hypothetical protein
MPKTQREEPTFRFFRKLAVNPISGRKKWRTIGEPNDTMRRVHAEIKRYIRRLWRRPYWAVRFGSVKMSSAPALLRTHLRLGNRYYVSMDIASAFESIDGTKLAETICDVDPQYTGKQEEVLTFLQRYCLHRNGGLVVGAPASNYWFELYLKVHLDPAIRTLCQKYRLHYTRFADDLLFSSRFPVGRRKRATLAAAIRSVGFRLSCHKCQVLDLKKGDVFINGIGIHPDGTTFLKRSKVKELCCMLRQALGESHPKHNVISGSMSTFFAFTGKRRPQSRLEKELISLYDQYRARFFLIQSESPGRKLSRNPVDHPVLIDVRTLPIL